MSWMNGAGEAIESPRIPQCELARHLAIWSAGDPRGLLEVTAWMAARFIGTPLREIAASQSCTIRTITRRINRIDHYLADALPAPPASNAATSSQTPPG